jgi:acetylornithine/succinyldiaminopimelate/putrescine aminotransferase
MARALADQAKTLLHTSNLYYHPLQGELAAKLTALSGLERVFFCNSGTEANEACLKFARRYWHTKGDTHRTHYVAFVHSFHGRTMGALSVTADPHYRTPFGPLVPGVSFVDPNDPDALAALVTDQTAAIIVEPIQGEGGVRPVSPALARAISEACQRTGALLIADEVQSGSGRTGAFLCSQLIGLRPDLVALGKALGGGVPVGAALVSGRVAAAVAPGDHGTTYGGNPLACRAALVFLEALADLTPSMRRVGTHLARRLRELASRHAGSVVEVRGAGLIAGVELTGDASPVVSAAFDRGLLVNRTANSVIRLLPPFIVTEHDVDEAVGILDEALIAFERGVTTASQPAAAPEPERAPSLAAERPTELPAELPAEAATRPPAVPDPTIPSDRTSPDAGAGSTTDSGEETSDRPDDSTRHTD